VTDEKAHSGLPIVIGVESFGALGVLDESRLRNFFENEFRSKRQLYPHSPLLLLIRAAAPLREIVGTAAAALDICISVSGKCEADPLAACCHVVISVRRSGASGEGQATVGAYPWQGRAGGIGLNDDNIRLEPQVYLEFIEVLLDTAAGNAGHTVSRKWTPGVEFDSTLVPQLGDHTLRRTDDFNRDAAALMRRGDGLAGPAGSLDLPCEVRFAGERTQLRQIFAVADALSSAYQAKVTRAFQSIFVLATAAAVFYGIFLIFGSGNVQLQEWLLSLYLLTLLAAYGVYYRTKRDQLHDRFVEYRALAEGARVQFYWAACGLDQAAADCYFLRNPLELHWIRLALHWAAWAQGSQVETAQVDPDCVQRILLHWIGREKGYYGRSATRSVRAEARARVLVRVTFVLGGCATALVLLQSYLTPLAPLLKRISFVSFMCPSIAAALVALVHKLGVVYRAQHHSRMLALYGQAELCANHSAPTAASKIAIALGVAALRESEEWTVFRRDRRVDEPASPFRRPW
jgi:hypothetical protein